VAVHGFCHPELCGRSATGRRYACSCGTSSTPRSTATPTRSATCAPSTTSASSRIWPSWSGVWTVPAKERADVREIDAFETMTRTVPPRNSTPPWPTKSRQWGARQWFYRPVWRRKSPAWSPRSNRSFLEDLGLSEPMLARFVRTGWCRFSPSGRTKCAPGRSGGVRWRVRPPDASTATWSAASSARRSSGGIRDGIQNLLAW